MLIILLLILALGILYIYIIDDYNLDKIEKYSIESVNKSTIKANKLRNIIYIFHKLCEHNNIYYIISYGTLLGAVRHWGMIPWDDDIDVIVKNADRGKIYKILNEMMNDYGYMIEHTEKLSRVYSTVDKEMSYFMDIFFAENINGKVVRTYTHDFDKIQDSYTEYYLNKSDENSWWWNGFDFDVNLIEKRKKFIYDDMKLWGPSEPIKLLAIWYGKDFLTICKTHYLKNHNEYIEPKIITYNNLPQPQI